MMKREKGVINICCVAAVLNLLLFFVKLYVSLSANSISIFSDAINNLADSLSCVVSIGCMAISIKLMRKGTDYLCGKIEQLLSLGLSVIVAVVGISFAYSSLERFMYPTPIWFTTKYFAMITLTAMIKLLMFFVLRLKAKKNNSAVIRVMQADSLMDFFVTSVTLVSFVATQYTDFMIDAFAGLIISVIIIISAIKLIKSNLFGVINFVPEQKRNIVEKSVEKMKRCEVSKITYSVESETETTAYVSVGFDGESTIEQMKNEIDTLTKSCESAGINVRVIID
ncbi:MAG: cation diffusion facilitator family transporter [Ruminococcus sp.]|nr:cation diffusion facilitator family transporter [Ruminococcus sp.]MCM1391977.1 cation diffusion facilitator family transporter [Ruminococcus sp.]